VAPAAKYHFSPERKIVMSQQNVIRAWKDPEYRASLSDAQRAMLPENPAGMVELEPAELNRVEGGADAFAASRVALKTYVCVWCVSQKLHNGWNIGVRR
jgi:mersacidin/lichenicidin family type 2 lantibiotic